MKKCWWLFVLQDHFKESNIRYFNMSTFHHESTVSLIDDNVNVLTLLN